jgi:hypothetical protein
VTGDPFIRGKYECVQGPLRAIHDRHLDPIHRKTITCSRKTQGVETRAGAPEGED